MLIMMMMMNSTSDNNMKCNETIGDDKQQSVEPAAAAGSAAVGAAQKDFDLHLADTRTSISDVDKVQKDFYEEDQLPIGTSSNSAHFNNNLPQETNSSTTNLKEHSDLKDIINESSSLKLQVDIEEDNFKLPMAQTSGGSSPTTPTMSNINANHQINNHSKKQDTRPFDRKQVVCLEDFESLARDSIEEEKFHFLFHGADEEWTLRWNHQMIIEKYFLKPRILRDVSNIDTTKYIFGDRLSMPIGMAPTGLHKAFNDQGELETVRAASNFNALMVLSQFSTTSLEDVAKEAPICTKWQNIYLLKNREHTQLIINKAIRYGYRAIVVTCDAPILGHRRKVMQGDLDLSCYKLKIISLEDNASGNNKTDSIRAHSEAIFDSSLTWADLAELKRGLGDTIKVIVKGILTPSDAEQALKAGMDGIYVSNHGGRQLDCCQSTIEALPAIVRVVKKRVPVFVDGGFRTGSDVMKALALGADMVFLGRPILYSLSVAGGEGVSHALKLIYEELTRCMALCGCRNLAEIGLDCIKERD